VTHQNNSKVPSLPREQPPSSPPFSALPRAPVLDWSSFKRVNAPNISSVENLPNVVFTTSGRAAIYQALLQMKLAPGSLVLVPTYHCPTMVAPALLANLDVAYYGLQADGLPNLDTISQETAEKCGAMLVPHYFGIAKSLKTIRQWCTQNNIALIEDCAHCYFGEAGERPVGSWGDYATASLSKFLPVPEAGLLASANRPIHSIQPSNQKIKYQIKGFVDVIEYATRHHRLAGFRFLFGALFKLKNLRTKPTQFTHSESPRQEKEMMRDCDMDRIKQAPLWASMLLKFILPRGRIINRRRENFSRYAMHFANIAGAKPLFPELTETNSPSAPYVFPLWVEDPETIYKSIRALELPIFRWDRIWPNTPALQGDVGPQWSHHVLQLLCHQDLDTKDIDATAQSVLRLLEMQKSASTAVPA
jgi:perosamine synthetase